MRHVVRRLVVAGVVGLAILAAACGRGGTATFEALLNGTNEVPPVVTAANGKARFEYEVNIFRFRIEVFAASSTVTAAHIHGPAGSGQNAGVIVTLFTGAAPPPVDGVLIEGTFGPSAIDPASGVTWSQLVELMRTSTAYVNVHTANYPGGEIRGQIRLVTGIEEH